MRQALRIKTFRPRTFPEGHWLAVHSRCILTYFKLICHIFAPSGVGKGNKREWEWDVEKELKKEREREREREGKVVVVVLVVLVVVVGGGVVVVIVADLTVYGLKK